MIGAYLNERISLQRPAKLEDEGAGKRVVWQDAGTVWARVAPISSRERFYAGQNMVEVTHRVNIRYRTDVKSDMRIKRGEAFYLIDSIVDVDGGRLFLELLCTEVQENE